VAETAGMERIRANYQIPEVLMQPPPQPPTAPTSSPAAAEEPRKLDDTMANLKISSSSDYAPSIKEDEKRMPSSTSSGSFPTGFEEKFEKGVRLTSIPESPFPSTPTELASPKEDDEVFLPTVNAVSSQKESGIGIKFINLN
jgi:hypothetical protein